MLNFDPVRHQPTDNGQMQLSSRLVSPEPPAGQFDGMRVELDQDVSDFRLMAVCAACGISCCVLTVIVGGALAGAGLAVAGAVKLAEGDDPARAAGYLGGGLAAVGLFAASSIGGKILQARQQRQLERDLAGQIP